MEWRPKRWLATLLSLFVAPLGMLYLQRPRLALIYLLASLFLQIVAVGSFAVLGMPVIVALWGANWGVNLVAAIHAFRLSRAMEPVAPRLWYSRWYGLIGIWAAFTVGVFLFRSFAYEPFRTPSDSMYPTLPDGSFVIVGKWGYGDYGSLNVRFLDAEPTAAVARGELLLFRLSDKPETVYLKRVIGLPGDRIQCSKERITINGTPVAATPLDSRGRYGFARETIDGVSFTVAHLDRFPALDCDLVVPEGHYYMLGDNRENSRDSRHIGPVPRGNLVGRVALAFPVRASSQEE
ncbi:signal peptidase I [Peristeroidobacter soli]|uniref:signal peptidase I n=1 Tax=Peristeroidobacter soli TaxID=2497877 RepID=UPI00101E206C|nr:signal peptidase I [Peristeroidobacter soli]